jgi:hypothetical protein
VSSPVHRFCLFVLRLGARKSKNTALECTFEDSDALDSSDRETGAVTAVFWNAHATEVRLTLGVRAFNYLTAGCT